MLICRFYTQPVSTQAGADGDDKEDDENTNCDNVYKNSENRAIGCYSAHIMRQLFGLDPFDLTDQNAWASICPQTMESNHGELCHHNASLTRIFFGVDHIEGHWKETDIWFACAFSRGAEFDTAGDWGIRQSIRTKVIIYPNEKVSRYEKVAYTTLY